MKSLCSDVVTGYAFETWGSIFCVFRFWLPSLKTIISCSRNENRTIEKERGGRGKQTRREVEGMQRNNQSSENIIQEMCQNLHWNISSRSSAKTEIVQTNIVSRAAPSVDANAEEIKTICLKCTIQPFDFGQFGNCEAIKLGEGCIRLRCTHTTFSENIFHSAVCTFFFLLYTLTAVYNDSQSMAILVSNWENASYFKFLIFSIRPIN